MLPPVRAALMYASVCMMAQDIVLTCALTACDSAFHPHTDSVTLLEGKQLRENMEIGIYDTMTNIQTILTLSFSVSDTHTHTKLFFQALSRPFVENIELILVKGFCTFFSP